MLACSTSKEVVHKEELISQLAKKNRPQQYNRDAIDEILASIQGQLAKGKSILGSFYTRVQKGEYNFKKIKLMENKVERQVALRLGVHPKQAIGKKRLT